MFGWRLPGMLAACITALLSSQARSGNEIINLSQNEKIAAFRVENTYENELGRTVGGRFRHIRSGFVLDLLRIQSVPQAFMWVNSFPPSDQGEPHTCEHLMLGKGSRGRYVASLEEMSLGNSSAFTAQLQTCYHFHTAAGPDVFFNLMEAKLNALIHPDFSDEEIRREVCHMGYTVDPVNGAISLEEKGTVYNEMVSSYERPWGNLGRELGTLLYGPNHPLSYESGGYPPAIRTMIPNNMREFIAKNYHISNMGMIVSIGDEISLDDCLKKISDILDRIEPEATEKIDPATADEYLPSPNSGPPGAIKVVSFPSQNQKDPGLLLFAWPPILKYDNQESYMLDLFMSNLASGETSNLFRKFIDSQTKVMNTGANAIFEWVSSDIGHPIQIGFNNIKQEACNDAVIDSIRTLILEEIDKICMYPDGSPELLSFNERAQNRIIERRRDLRNFLNTPPGFGYRGTSGRWLDHLKYLQKEPGFKKSLTLNEELKFAEKELSQKKNIWKDYIAKWKLLDNKPFAVASCPDTLMMRNIELDKNTRVAEYIKGLRDKYRVASDSEAIALFKTDYDAKTRIIDSTAAEIAMPKFVSNPPLTLDDQLHYTVEKLSGGGNIVTSTFENMTSATVGLAFRMDVIPESLLLYTSVLPTLLTEVGVVKSHPYTYDEMKEAIRREILDLQAYYSSSYRTGRVELVIRGAGSDKAESEEALKWLEAVLFNPLWTKENLPRMRDALHMALSDLRNTMRGSEESWVDDPANAYWRQENPLILTSSCFLTQAHDYQKMLWLLKDPGSEANAQAFSLFMNDMVNYGEQANRHELLELLGLMQGDTTPLNGNPSPGLDNIIAKFQTLPAPVRDLVLDAVEDLKYDLAGIPDATLSEDWKYLCNEIDTDLQVPPEKALSDLQYVMDLIRRSDNVRAFMISNSTNQIDLMPLIEKILARLSDKPSIRQTYSSEPHIVARLKDRLPVDGKPVYVGLINDNTSLGVHINSAPCASFTDYDRDTLLKFLSARLYGGGGAHSMFMKTWSAGLAYSNGLRSNEFTGRLIYYAERCPDLAQTMQFVVSELKKAQPDSSLAEYAVAQAFAMYRSGSRYESRGEAMASDLADSLTPEMVKRFREGILELRKDPELYKKLFAMMEDTYGEVLPGYGPRGDSVKDALYFIIGPESQFRSYEDYLNSVEGKVSLYRLYPRDFWLVKPKPAPEIIQ
jgi:Zn-dependent M16 (insulinase) family peptidase